MNDPLGELVDEALKRPLSPINGADGDPRPAPPDESPPLLRQLDYVVASDLATDGQQVFDDELIEGFLGRCALAVLYGDTNSGKTFGAVDIGAAISRGIPWLGRQTVQGPVLYLASEAPASVELRVKTYQRRFGVKLPALFIVPKPIDLFDGDADVTAVVALADTLEAQLGQRFALVIGDTLARLSAGANENSGEDMGVVLRHVDAIRAATGAAFLLVHHTGKDAAKGMRGWSGLRAAVDTEIEVTADEATGQHCLEVTKQRDLPGKGLRIGFKLEVVMMGRNLWGSERGSCVVLPTDAPAKVERAKRPSEIAGAIFEFLSQRGAGCKKGELVKHLADRYQARSVYREIRKLTDSGRLHEVAGVVALPGPAPTVANVANGGQ